MKRKVRSDILKKIFLCVEVGKVNKSSPYPPAMKDHDGADELAKQALELGYKPLEILEKALMPAMATVGDRFSRREIYVPQMLMSARAMSSVMIRLKPFFQTGEPKKKGTFIIGTVAGDLHDIGKNLLAMMIRGGGWEVIDLGVDVRTERFLTVIDENPGAIIGLSALLTTTMENMRIITGNIKTKYPDSKILIGGAPVTRDFCNRIGADYYTPDPQEAIYYINRLIGERQI